MTAGTTGAHTAREDGAEDSRDDTNVGHPQLVVSTGELSEWELLPQLGGESKTHSTGPSMSTWSKWAIASRDREHIR